MVVDRSAVALGDRYHACAAAEVTQIGVRARDLALVPPDTPNVLRGSVYVVEPLGDEVYVDVLVGTTRVSVRADRGWTAPLGTAVGVLVDPTRACFFCADGTTAVHRSAGGTAFEPSVRPSSSPASEGTRS
jgi:ABC-type sugar transport system ATPase subunit